MKGRNAIGVRPAAVAGLFYPADPEILAAQVNGLLAAATAGGAPPKAVIVPHAGYVYSGPVAAAAYGCLRAVRETISRWSHQGFHYQHFGRLYAEVEVALYRGHGRSAWRLVEAGWGDLAASMIQRIEMVLVQSHDLRGRATLAAAARENDRRFQAGLMARAETDARTLGRSGSRWSRGLAAMLSAGVAALGGDADGARARLVAAGGHFEAAAMAVHRAVARRRLAELEADDSGIAAADRELEELGIRNPRAMADVFAPGRWF